MMFSLTILTGLMLKTMLISQIIDFLISHVKFQYKPRLYYQQYY